MLRAARRRAAVSALAVVVACVALLATGCGGGAGGRSTPSPLSSPTFAPATSGPSTSSVPRSSSPSPDPASPAVTTPQGMWWGVDSTVPITSSSVANVHGWSRGAHPQFWGRYVRGHFAVSKAELARARKFGIYVFLIVPDHNCSGCSGGDICGQDRTSAQARTDALDAVAAARRVGVARGALLFKDIEEVGGCDGPTGDYLIAWYRTVRSTEFRPGFYGNVHHQDFDFPRAYCSAVHRDAQFARDVVLDMNEDEPRIGAPSGSTGPHNAPKFTPKSPNCAPKQATVIWQYGESLTTANVTDIDQARPNVAGMLAPGGGVTG